MPEKSIVDLEPDVLEHQVRIMINNQNDDACDKIILAHRRLARIWAGRIARRYQIFYRLEELRAQADCSLVIAVNRAKNGALKDLNITPFIVTTIKGDLLHLVFTYNLIMIKRHAYRGQRINIIRGVEDTIVDNTFEQEQKAYEIEESICKSKKDLFIVDKLLAGYTLGEIGKFLGISCNAVWKRVQKIRDRYRRLYNAY